MLVCEDISGVSKVIPSVTCRGVKVQRLNPAVQGQGCQAGVMTLVNLKRAGVGRINTLIKLICNKKCQILKKIQCKYLCIFLVYFEAHWSNLF